MIPEIRPNPKLGLNRHLLGLSAMVWTLAAPAALPDPLAAGWRGKPVCDRLHEDATQRILRCTFTPGGGHDRHYHDAHFGYAVLGGRMRIEDENGVREVDVASGSGFTSQGVAWHQVLNVGDTTAVFLIVEPK